jgi:hypothetical protein
LAGGNILLGLLGQGGAKELYGKTLEEFPKNLTRERQRMIIALTRYIRTELSMMPALGGLPQSSNEEQQPFAPERSSS